MSVIADRELDARLLGGTAVWLRCPSSRTGALARSYEDVDLAVRRRGAVTLGRELAAIGFAADRQFNALHGQHRMVFSKDGVVVDVFVGEFEQCQKLDLEERIGLESTTLAAADLLLTKLQVVEVTRKDLTDAIALLLDHAPTDHRGEGAIDLGAFTSVTRSDWGWHTCALDNLRKVMEEAARVLDADGAERVTTRAEAILQAMDAAPKTMGWKLRARVGRRVPWYTIPDSK